MADEKTRRKAASAEKPATIWTPANIVTTIRLVFVPFWVAFAMSVGPTATTGNWVSGLMVALTFAILSGTDKLDGYLARSRNEITRFGKFLDPIADKMVVVCSLLVLMDWDYVNLWVLIIIVAREFMVSALRMIVATDGVVVAASNLGKWKTATTMGCIIGFLIVAAIPAGMLSNVLLIVSQFALAAAVILTIWSGVDYFMKCKDSLLAPEEFDEASASNISVVAAEPAQSAAPAVAQENQEADDGLPSWDEICNYAGYILDKARRRNITIGTAESCTGGLVEAALTAIPGSSDVVKGAIGSYANSVKHNVLNVDNNILEIYGAVSAECAQQMARGACQSLGCDVSVSVTGIAGPGGGTQDKPVGLVWFGVCYDGFVTTESYIFEGNRSQVRKQSVIHALQLFEETL